MTRLILFNKPYGVVSQFRADPGKPTLADFFCDPSLRIAGRLDQDSEGLLLLTDNGQLVQRISHPRHKMLKTYWVQVEGAPDADAIRQLQRGVILKDGPTRPAQVEIFEPPTLWPRQPPIRQREHIPTHWLSIGISEGRNRQVRRMTAAVGLPTLRLIRQAIGPWQLNGLTPGEFRTASIHLPATAMPNTKSTRPRRGLQPNRGLQPTNSPTNGQRRRRKPKG